MVNFNDSIAIVFRHEGGLADVREDRGGLTKYGISQARYPNLDIRNLTLAEAREIYRRDYWYKFRLNELTRQNIANMALDMVVLHGKGIKLLQKALNDTGERVIIDNIIGPQTIKALNKVPETPFISNAVKRRKQYMINLVESDPNQAKFLTGWFKRADFFLSKPGVIITGTILAIAAGVLTYYLWPNGKKN